MKSFMRTLSCHGAAPPSVPTWQGHGPTPVTGCCVAALGKVQDGPFQVWPEAAGKHLTFLSLTGVRAQLSRRQLASPGARAGFASVTA